MTTEIKTILISVIVSVTLFVVFVNSPAHLYSFKHWFPQGNLGTTLTTITSSNQLSDFPTTYNANLVLINAGKMEVSTTSVASITTLSNLVTVGALASGSLTTGFTDIPVAVGGTGSSTPYGLLWGDGAGAFSQILDGANGQFLTSGGGATLPTFTTSAVDQAIDYTWTGHHIFSSLFATVASSTNATSTNLTITGNLIFSGSSVEGIAKPASTTTFTASGTYGKTSGVKKVLVQAWGGGGGGGADPDNAAGSDIGTGGGGGTYFEKWFEAGDLGATETITIGAGGATATAGNGGAGGNTTFGSLLTAYGGGAGIRHTAASTDVGGGGGGGWFGVGGIGQTTSAGAAGSPGEPFAGDGDGSLGVYAGGGGWKNSSEGTVDGGNSIFGGAGGGAARGNPATTSNGGTSKFGGAGGAANGSGDGVAGSVPSGGGGASLTGTSGAGGAGQIIVTEFF